MTEDFDTFWVPRHNVKIAKEGNEAGKAPFLPFAADAIRTTPIYNVASGYILPAIRLIPCQFEMLKKGYIYNYVITRPVLTSLGFKLKNEDDKGVLCTYKDEMGEVHTIALYFADQVERTLEFVKYAKEHIQPHSNLSDVHLYIRTSDPVEYFGSYLTACRCGMELEASRDVVSEFRGNLNAILENDLRDDEYKDKAYKPYSTILFLAQKRAVEIERTLLQERNN